MSESSAAVRLGQITWFNAKTDYKDYWLRYTAVALLAIGLMVFSTQMPNINALRSIKPEYVLYSGAGLLGIELLIFGKRNMTWHYRVDSLALHNVHRCLQLGQYFQSFNLNGKKQTAYRGHDQAPEFVNKSISVAYPGAKSIPHWKVLEACKVRDATKLVHLRDAPTYNAYALLSEL